MRLAFDVLQDVDANTCPFVPLEFTSDGIFATRVSAVFGSNGKIIIGTGRDLSQVEIVGRIFRCQSAYRYVCIT